MRAEGDKLTTEQHIVLAEYLSRRAYSAELLPETAFCSAAGPGPLDVDEVSWMGWGGNLSGTGFQTTERAGLTASDVPDPVRTRRLLLHRREIDRLGGKTRERGITLIPTRIYFKNGKAKVEIALARGKEKQDKRQDERTSEAKRDIERAMKSSRR